jgi:hypothetical protein
MFFSSVSLSFCLCLSVCVSVSLSLSVRLFLFTSLFTTPPFSASLSPLLSSFSTLSLPRRSYPILSHPTLPHPIPSYAPLTQSTHNTHSHTRTHKSHTRLTHTTPLITFKVHTGLLLPCDIEIVIAAEVNRRSGLFTMKVSISIPRIRFICDPRQLEGTYSTARCSTV